jgi:tetratricopeptide (TPR) repeat protein
VTAAIRRLGDPTNALVATLLFLFTLAVYTITLTPTTPFWDSGEFIATSYILGVPHAPGTPLYVLLGRVFTLFPFGNVAQRVNWLSAISSSLTLLFIYLITVKIARFAFPWEARKGYRHIGFLAGAVAVFIAGFATTFWDDAVEAEVYASSCFLMALVIWLILRWQERLDEGNEDGLLLVITYLVGLGVGIHLGVAIAAWAAVVFVFLCRPRYLARWDYLGWGLVTLSLATGVHLPAFLVAPVVLILTLGVWLLSGKLRHLALWSSVLFMLGISVHFFLIIRSNLDPMINEAAPKDWDALWKTLIRDQYKPAPITQRKADLWYQFDVMWLRYMWWNFSVTGEQIFEGAYRFRHFLRGLFQPPILLTIAGAIVHLRRDRRSGALLGILFLLLGPAMAIYLNFRQGEVRERDYFFVQNFMYMAIWTGIGAAWLADWVRDQLKGERAQTLGLAAASVLLVFMSLLPLAQNWRSHDRRGFFVARDYAYNILMGLDQNAMIFTNGDNDTFPLWYIQEVEGIRKDVRVVNLSLLNTDWYIEQLRDLDPKVPITWTDDQIAQLFPFRDNAGKVWLVKDIAAHHILETNAWKQPVYLAVTVPEQMGLESQLSMEGLAFRILPEKTDMRVNVERTMKNLNEVYRYGGLVLHDPKDPNRWLHDTVVYKDDNASRLTQNYAAAFTRVAIEQMEQGQYDEALKQIERAMAVAPAFTGGTITYGVLLEEVGRLGEAEAHYRRELERVPGDWQLLYRLAECLNREKKPEESIPYYEQAIQGAPSNQYYPYQGLAGVYYQLNRYDKAANVLERWLILHPDDRNVKAIYDELRQSLASGAIGGGEDTLSGTKDGPPGGP